MDAKDKGDKESRPCEVGAEALDVVLPHIANVLDILPHALHLGGRAGRVITTAMAPLSAHRRAARLGSPSLGAESSARIISGSLGRYSMGRASVPGASASVRSGAAGSHDGSSETRVPDRR